MQATLAVGAQRATEHEDNARAMSAVPQVNGLAIEQYSRNRQERRGFQGLHAVVRWEHHVTFLDCRT
jgi:hypothetical protein